MRTPRIPKRKTGTKKPSKEHRERVVEWQGGACIYCGLPFGSTVFRGGKEFLVCMHWDHFQPYALVGNSEGDDNYVAACQFCNWIKGDKIFADIEDARAFILKRRNKKGIAAEARGTTKPLRSTPPPSKKEMPEEIHARVERIDLKKLCAELNKNMRRGLYVCSKNGRDVIEVLPSQLPQHP